MREKLPFVLHALAETAAGLSFLAAPRRHLPGPPSPDAELVLQSYGGLLLTSVALCLVFAARDFDHTSRAVAVVLATYHVFPMMRAVQRLRKGLGVEGARGRFLGGPLVHLVVHAVLCASLFLTGFTGILWSR